MHTTTVKIDRSRTITVSIDTLKVIKGHPGKLGAGCHTDKRDRRTTRRSRNLKVIQEF